jgi:hypothetical protein
MFDGEDVEGERVGTLKTGLFVGDPEGEVDGEYEGD